ncbi:MAG TPA: glycosyltransferase [Dehalococcoidia bacterium]|nr:glycosyltransferase [Dehalococcoidia bacterium]
MQVCIVYDCLYPYTVGGAERWYRNIAERVAARGEEVTLLTLRQWQGNVPSVPGVRVVSAGPRMSLYTSSGRRRLLPPVVFALGVLVHLLRHGRRYDVVHTASFPYFPLLVIAAARRACGFRVVVDWHEVWTRDYWRSYVGSLGGLIGWWVQGLCLRVRQRAFCFSVLHERRLRELGLEAPLTRLEGQYDLDTEQYRPQPLEPVVLFAGRHIPEKRPAAVVPAVVAAKTDIPDLRAEIFGDGPERSNVLAAIAELGAGSYVSAPGFVDGATLEKRLSTALCVVLPSSREGYGRIVVEAAARGVPTVVVAGPDNAATELMEEGVNGTVAPSAGPDDLAGAIVRIYRAGGELRDSTLEWFRRNAPRLSLEPSVAQILEAYASA